MPSFESPAPLANTLILAPLKIAKCLCSSTSSMIQDMKVTLCMSKGLLVLH